MAAAASTIQSGPMVTPLIRRRLAVVSRQAVTQELLSHGRLILGFVIGDDGDVGELSRFGELVDAPTREGLSAKRSRCSPDFSLASRHVIRARSIELTALPFVRRPLVGEQYSFGLPLGGPITPRSCA
jgi:alkanesulfonate monooxygenase SsuD/methylene tetrahydromethanopterin reductase-like flavin-dependent oxidoreductase (luciferase family)